MRHSSARLVARRRLGAVQTAAVVTTIAHTVVRAVARARGLAHRRARAMDAFVIRTKRPAGTSSESSPSVARASRKRPMTTTMAWRGYDNSLLVKDDERCAPSTKIAGFDLDETVQRTRSGRKAYLAAPDDFTYLNAHVTRVIRALHADGYKICIFSNQGSVKGALEGKKATDVRIRLTRLAEDLETPFQAFCATQINKPGKPVVDPHEYRKGGDGMWKRMVREHNGGIEPDLEKCFFVGDAAGRAGDHSDADLQFAKRVGIKFYTPEEIFVEKGEPWK